MISWRNVQDEFAIDDLDYSKEFTIETWIMSCLARYDLVIFVVSLILLK